VVTASLFQPLLGGKGGFGALLKAAAGKAGAKKTTDFGACRDLNGRRLRHVNDEVKLSRWKRNKELEADGKEALDETTESGIENWHLGTPTWAGGQSNKEAYRAAKRKRVDKKKATEKKARLADEAERKKSSEDGLVSAYMGDYDSQVGGSEANNDDLTNVVMKEMRRKKDAKALAKQLAGVWGENGLMDVTGGGEVLWKKGGLVKGGGGGSGKDAKPVFSTVFAPGARLRPDDGKVYFEAVIQQSAAKDPAPTQLGVLDQGNLPSATEDDGVGDVKNSFAWDGGRGQLLAEGEEVSLMRASEEKVVRREGNSGSACLLLLCERSGRAGVAGECPDNFFSRGAPEEPELSGASGTDRSSGRAPQQPPSLVRAERTGVAGERLNNLLLLCERSGQE
jgi:hypothetical protein